MLTTVVELEGGLAGVDGHRHGANGGHGRLEGVFAVLPHVHETRIVSTNRVLPELTGLVLGKKISPN